MKAGGLRAYIGLGSNLDDPVRQVRRAIVELSSVRLTELASFSSLYRSPPMGPSDQPDYINAVAALDTGLDSDSLLAELQSIERRHGRKRTGKRWTARTLDLDLLVFGDMQIDSRHLMVPHPGIRDRSFVLYPLAEIAHDLEIPGMGPIDRLLESCTSRDLQKLPSDDC